MKYVPTIKSNPFAGRVVIADPCYVLDNSAYQELIRQMQRPEYENTAYARGGLFIHNNKTGLVITAAEGDGVYGIKDVPGRVGTDTGLIAVMEFEMFQDSSGMYFLPESAPIDLIIQARVIGTVKADAIRGAFYGPGFQLITWEEQQNQDTAISFGAAKAGAYKPA